MKKLVLDSFIITIVYLLAIAIPAFSYSLIIESNDSNSLPFTLEMILGGIVLDAFRGWATVWFYHHSSFNKLSIHKTLLFSLVISLLGASLGIYFLFFSSSGTIDLLRELGFTVLQGLLVGISLWYLNRNEGSIDVITKGSFL